MSTNESTHLETLAAPTPWPGANARLLGLGLGLPVDPLVRLAGFDAAAFERFTLEWAHGYLSKNIPGIHEIQQRGGSGDKGRDIIVWLDPPSARKRRWLCFQCKHLDEALGPGRAATEIGKLLYHAQQGEYPVPEEYWFVTHAGVTGTLQDLLDAPDKFRTFVLSNWSKHAERKIGTNPVHLTPELETFIQAVDFSRFRAKQPRELLDEHAQTPYHLRVFGLPLVERGPCPQPPSHVAAAETEYLKQLYAVIGESLNRAVTGPEDFAHEGRSRALFERSRMTFYSAEGLKELARDTMLDARFFDTLLIEFIDGLYHDYTEFGITGHQRLINTIKSAQRIDIRGHLLHDHVVAADREGMCHHMANGKHVQWCGGPDA